MADRLSYLLERLNTSLWPIPLAWCLGTVALALLMLWIDNRPSLHDGTALLFELDAETARRVVGIVAGSIIGVGGVAFSITMVAMTLTSGQYGPRVLRTFLESTVAKHTLGLFLGTYVYSLVVLTGQDVVTTPRLAVVTSLVLASAALFGFVQFMHRTATDLQADEIIHRIGRQLCRALEELAEDADPKRRSGDTTAWRRAAATGTPYRVASRSEGYVQSVDYDGLLAWCQAHEVQLIVHARAGDFLVRGVCLFTVYGNDQASVEQALDDVEKHVVTGPMRTPVQDVEFSAAQLKQLAARALSPGINDPGTAVTCIDWFCLALAGIVDRDLPGCTFATDDGRARILASVPDFSHLMGTIYAPLRQLSRSDVSVSARLLESLCRLAELTRRFDRLQTLLAHGRLIMDALQHQQLADIDRLDLQRRYARLRRLATIAA